MGSRLGHERDQPWGGFLFSRFFHVLFRESNSAVVIVLLRSPPSENRGG